MRKNKRIYSLILALIIFLGNMPAILAMEENEAVLLESITTREYYEEKGLTHNRPSIQQIREYFKDYQSKALHKKDFLGKELVDGTNYDAVMEEKSDFENNKPGTVSQAAKEDYVHIVNTARYSLGVDGLSIGGDVVDKVTKDEYNAEKAAKYSSLFLAKNNKIDHDPATPEGLEDFERLAKTGATKANLSSDPDFINTAKMFLDDSRNISDNVAHRNWFLAPVVKEINFGFATNNSRNAYTTATINNKSNLDIFDEDFVIPYVELSEFYTENKTWNSIGFSENYRFENVKVKVTDLNTGDEHNFEEENGLVLKKDVWNGIVHNILFGKNLDYSHGNNYYIEIEGVKRADLGFDKPFYDYPIKYTMSMNNLNSELVNEIPVKEIKTDVYEEPFERFKEESSDLLVGEEKVKQEGIKGKRTVVSERFGEEDFKIISNEITKDPINEIILVGTKETVKETEKEIPLTPLEPAETIEEEKNEKNGIYEEEGKLFYYENGEKIFKGLFTLDGETYYAGRGGELVTSRRYYVTKNNELLPQDHYTFDEQGRLLREEKKEEIPSTPLVPAETKEETKEEIPSTPLVPAETKEEKNEKNGIYEEEGKLFYYEDDIRTFKGLFELDGNHYFAKRDGELVTSRRYYVTKDNKLLPKDHYTFDEQGRIVEEESNENLKNGIYEEEGKLFFYENGEKTFKGLFELDGNYYFAKRDGELVVSRRYYVTKDNKLLPKSHYNFDEKGRIVEENSNENLKNGIYEEEGKLFFYENGEKTFKGLFELDGNYYFAKRDGELVVSRRYYVTKDNGLLPVSHYTFDANGVITDAK